MNTIDKAYDAGWCYWEKNQPVALCKNLASHARSCGWHDDLTYAWLDGFFDAKMRDVERNARPRLGES